MLSADTEPKRVAWHIRSAAKQFMHENSFIRSASKIFGAKNVSSARRQTQFTITVWGRSVKPVKTSCMWGNPQHIMCYERAERKKSIYNGKFQRFLIDSDKKKGACSLAGVSFN